MIWAYFGNVWDTKYAEKKKTQKKVSKIKTVKVVQGSGIMCLM